MTAVAPDTTMPTPEWTRFLREATGADASLSAYLQRAAGYVLTGKTSEQVLFFVWGPGGTGKSLFLTTLQEAMGDYARPAAMDTFTASHSEKHPADLAALMGARLVTASETQAGRRWDEAKLKSITGGDRIAARFMRQDFFHYLPTFKLLFTGNHKPEIRDIDAAMRRRIHLVPFIHPPAVVDRTLPAKLKAELPGILAWMLEGCRQWQAEGLAMPPVVAASTEEYFSEQDAIGRWVKEQCDVGPEYQATTQELYQAFREWANRNGEWVGTAQRLAAALVLQRFEKWREPATRRHGFQGIQPKQEMMALS
jgi:putative DNA primase/helicase